MTRLSDNIESTSFGQEKGLTKSKFQLPCVKTQSGYVKDISTSGFVLVYRSRQHPLKQARKTRFHLFFWASMAQRFDIKRSI